MARNNIVSFGSHKNHMPKSHLPPHSAVQSCRGILKESLPKCFVFFKSLDDSLFKLADQAKDNNTQQDYFVAMRLFRIKQDDIKEEFTQLMLKDFDAFWSENNPSRLATEKNPSSELSLMHNDALEEQIALKQITTKAESVLKNQLHQLNRRFAHILNIDKKIENPLSAQNLANNLQKVISPITENISILLVAYKQFEQHAIPVLEALYEDINKELIKQNILPKLAHKPRKSSKPSSNDKDFTVTENLEEDSVTFDDLRQLLGSVKNIGREDSENITATPATVHNVLSALSGLQQQYNLQTASNDNGETSLPDLRQSLLTSLSQRQTDGTMTPHSLSRLDEDTMNVIEFLFEFILGDQAIPAKIRAILARLQLPMLKVAITDKTFFSKKKHSARLLLNNLAKASTGWGNYDDKKDILFSQIESIVNSILTDFDSNLEIFTELNDQLIQFLQQQEQSSNFSEKRIAQATEGQEKLLLAKQEVDNIINKLMAKYSPVPKAVVTLIDDSWRQILRLRFLQKGGESSEWKEAVLLMEELLWSVTPKSAPEDRKKLLETIPKLLKSLRMALGGASFNQHKITALFKDLQECHIKCLNGNELEEEELEAIDPKEQIDVFLEQKSEDLSEIPKENKVISDEQALNTAKQLKVGTWIEVTENNQTQRIKFSWRSNLTGRCLFVTYQGLRATELALAELAGWFQQGQAIILDQVAEPLMDRALVSMKETIEHQGETQKA